jgi:hypothetical protein
MADYYPLIARAVAGLENSTGEARRAMYERARSALIAQLRSVEPALSESDITRERLALEEAVRKVEAEAAQRARSEPPRSQTAREESAGDSAKDSADDSAPAPARDVTRDAMRDAPRGDITRESARDPNKPRAGDALRSAVRGQPGASADQGSPFAQPQGAGAPRPRPSEGRPQDPRSQEMASARVRTNAPPLGRPKPPSLSDQNTRGFRDVVHEVNDLGRASTQASRSARRTYTQMGSPSPQFDRLEPGMENRGAEPDHDGTYYNETTGEAVRPQPPQQNQQKPRGARPPSRARRAGSSIFKALAVIGVLLSIAGLVIWQLPTLRSAVSNSFFTRLFTSAPPAQKDAKGSATTPDTRPKIPDRVGQSSQVAPVAQRVVLYDEDPSEPQGRQYNGTVVWRVENVPGGPNMPEDLAVRADIEIPDRKLKMSFLLRRNADNSLPASHTAELTFTLPADFSGGGVANVPGVLMKQNEQARGTPLAGLAVKVTDGFFLIGLSNVETDRQRNMQLLKDRAWFDVPIVYNNQRRAILAVEKGAPGERAFAEAFAAWGQ